MGKKKKTEKNWVDLKKTQTNAVKNTKTFRKISQLNVFYKQNSEKRIACLEKNEWKIAN